MNGRGPCPACTGTLDPSFHKDGLDYARCRRCASAIAAIPVGEPARYHDYLPDLTKTLPDATRRRYRELLASLEPFRTTGALVDVGCGGGFFVEVAAGAGWRAAGTEVSRAAVEFARSRGLAVHHGVLDGSGFAAGSLDVVTLFEVVEHVREPSGLLAEAAALLRPGGALYLTTPNFGSLTRRLLGSDWSVISRDHVSLMTPRGLRAAAERAGLEPLRLFTRNILPHEVARFFRRRRKGAGPVPPPMERTVALQARVEGSLLLRGAKRVVNLGLRATGLGDTLVLLARKPAGTR